MSINFKKLLLDMINSLLSGHWSVPEFEVVYYEFFVERVPDSSLTKEEIEVFSEIQEKLDFVTERPDPEDRKYGWIDYDEYVSWVRKTMDANTKLFRSH